MSHLNSSNFHVSHLLTLLHHSLYKLKENSSLKSCISNIILFKEEKKFEKFAMVLVLVVVVVVVGSRDSNTQ